MRASGPSYLRPSATREDDHEPGPDCYWARLKSLNTGDVIDNNISDGQQVVRILPTGTAFMTRGCGTWTKIG